ncbi:GIY-YIG homing endonuclease [Yersinia phage vB_YenM_TG1]|uniref:GIY-YIG homing endonuclease n=1 Tax=Yersinia phage vB_YenM_TG1 TaxID=1589265 RepID=A0A0B5A2B5_9CAUD|nr:HNH endonuclease [Yersinia phage vB_YenM_TG1]AJD81874.1 GIY-YIG homing endonuclease [Yersinia phage vB_YenM_TG1]
MKYIAYLTIYIGDKLPPFYIGSTYLNKYHSTFYCGTIKSKKYKAIYDKEFKEHPELFDSCIIDEFDTREEATFCELYYQKLYNVVKSSEFFNMSYATINGCFGMDVKGKLNPFFNKSHSTKTIESQSKLKKGSLNPMYGLERKTHSEAMKGQKNPFFGKNHTEEARLKNSLAKRKSPVWNHESALRNLWIELNKPKLTEFVKESIKRGFPNANYKAIHRLFVRTYND